MTQERFRYTYQSKKTGLWWYRKQYNKGKPSEFNLRSRPIFESSAKAYLAFTEAEQRLHELGPEGLIRAMQRPVVPTFGELADKWFDKIAPVGRARGSVELYQRTYENHIKEPFAGLPLDHIDRGTVKDFLYGKLDTHAAGTVRLVRGVLSQILDEAVDRNHIAANPARGIRIKESKDSTMIERDDGIKKNPPFSRDELVLLFGVVKERYPDMHPLVYTLAWTGLRISEALGLKWTDIDYNKKIIKVRRGLGRDGIVAPKTFSSRREVEMSAGLADFLKAYDLETKKEALASGCPRLKYLFPGAYHDLRGYLLRSCQRTGIPRRSFHAFRHTYASWMLSRGARPDYIQRQLGHKDLTTTLNIYSHYIPDDRVSQADLADFHQSSPIGQGVK